MDAAVAFDIGDRSYGDPRFLVHLHAFDRGRALLLDPPPTSCAPSLPPHSLRPSRVHVAFRLWRLQPSCGGGFGSQRCDCLAALRHYPSQSANRPLFQFFFRRVGRLHPLRSLLGNKHSIFSLALFKLAPPPSTPPRRE